MANFWVTFWATFYSKIWSHCFCVTATSKRNLIASRAKFFCKFFNQIFFFASQNIFSCLKLLTWHCCQMLFSFCYVAKCWKISNWHNWSHAEYSLSIQHSFLKGAIPGLFFIYFRLFKQTLQFLKQIFVTKMLCPSSIKRRD